MGLTTSSHVFHPQHVTCYMAGKGKPCCQKDEDKRRDTLNKLKNLCCHSSDSKDKNKCCSKSFSPSPSASDALPLSKVLCNLKEAASFDKKCHTKISELMETQQELLDQIQNLEQREKAGIQMLKQADCMWSCMEDAYKKRVADSMDRQNNLIKQLKNVEGSNAKWRKNKKDLEHQMKLINNCQQEITDKLNQKNNDIKCINMEIDDFKKRIESNKKEIDVAKRSISTRKQASDIKIASIAAEITKFQKSVNEESKFKNNKEKDGNKFVKEAREDLQKICRVLLQKKLENEDLRAEKDALLQEIDLLNQTMDLCKDRCKNKQDSLTDEIKKIDDEIANYRVKCIRCHQCTDTVDVRKYCTDCPRCLEERDCIYEDDHCSPDSGMDCICMSVKQKFLDNVFDNMYTVLERQSKTGPGKAVAEAVLNGLKRSRNGKINEQTKKILQDFILNTVKKNLNLTIIGGAVKTRCELDPDSYKQLMLCLKQVTAVKAPKVDKGTVAKKESCRRWGGTSECNCPSGPKACICTKRAPPPPKDPTPCPPMDHDDDPPENAVCPHKEATSCGPDCAMHAVPSAVGADVAKWRPDPCGPSGPNGPFTKSMRAAQCVLGPESLNTLPSSFMSNVPYVPDIPVLEDLITCRCGKTPVKPCTCRGDPKKLKTSNVKICDKSTCAIIWRKKSEDATSLIEEKIRKESYVNYSPLGQSKIKDMPGKQATNALVKEDVKLDIDDNHLSSIKGVTFEKKNKDFTKNQFRVRTGESYDSESLTELTKTSSGTLAIALDNKIIELIDRKTAEDSNIMITLKKTASEQYTVDFNAENSLTNDAYKVMVNKTPSGNRTLEVHKKFIHQLQTKNKNGQVKIEEMPDLKIKKNEKEMTSACSKNGKKKDNKDKIINDLLKKYDAKTAVNVKLVGENGFITEINARLTKTISGNLAVDVHELAVLEEMSISHRERGVIIKETESGTFTLDIGHNKPSLNAVIRKTPSGAVLVVITDPVLMSMESTDTSIEKAEFYKLKIKNPDSANTCVSPAVLKTTASHNFLIVFDKEYEKRYKKIIQESVEDNTECCINIIKANSDCLINFDDSDKCYKPNALLVKSSSGNLKIKYHLNRKCLRKRSSDLGFKVFKNILTKLTPDTKLLVKNTQATNVIGAKSNSDPRLKAMPLMSENENFLTDSLKGLQKSRSGQYAVVLGKESKKAFINNFKKYLQNSSQGLIPVQRTESGEITVVLNDDQRDKFHFGSLKITPSGNIYVIVDENLKRIEKQECSVKAEVTEHNSIDTGSAHMIGHLKHPINKAVTTCCNALPDSCCCDSSKCVCKELKNNENEWKQEMMKKTDVLGLFRPEMCGIDWNEVKRNLDGSYKICDPEKCTEQCCKDTSKTKDAIKKNQDKLTHIVIKPCDCKTILKRNPREEQCFFVEAVCPYHMDRYNTLSNDLLEISSLCNKTSDVECCENDETIKSKPKNILHNNTTNWDSLHFLPPQLPAFLSKFKYR